MAELLNAKLEIVTPPASEPVTLAEAKAWARVDIEDDDALITSLIKSCREKCEVIVNRSFIATQFELTIDYFPPYASRYMSIAPPSVVGAVSSTTYHLNLKSYEVRLPFPKLLSVDEISYLDANGNEQTLDPSQYRVSLGTPGQITPAYGKMWPVSFAVESAVKIKYTAGYGADATFVPESVKDAIKTMVKGRYDQTVGIADNMGKAMETVHSLLDSEKWGMYA